MSNFKYKIFKILSWSLASFFIIFAFFTPEAKAGCTFQNVSGQFWVTDTNGKTITAVPDKNASIVLHAKWKGFSCTNADYVTSEFYAVYGTNGASQLINKKTDVLLRDGVSVEHVYTQGVSGLRDENTGQFVQNGGKIFVNARLVHQDLSSNRTEMISVKVGTPATTDLNSCQVEMYWRSNNKDFKEVSAKINDTYTIRVQYYSSANDNSCNARKMTIKVNKGQEQDKIFQEFTTTSGGFKDLTYKFPAEGTYQAFVTTKTSTSSVQRSTGVVTVQGTASGGGTNSGGGGGANPAPSTATPGGTGSTGGSGLGSMFSLVPCGKNSATSETGGPAGPRPADTCTVEDIFILMIRVTNYLLLIAGFFATFQIVRSAFSMVLSQGNSEAVTTAKKALTYSIMGLVLAAMAFLLINTVVVQVIGFSGAENILTNPGDYIIK